jgi:hypothetical protein
MHQLWQKTRHTGEGKYRKGQIPYRQGVTPLTTFPFGKIGLSNDNHNDIHAAGNDRYEWMLLDPVHSRNRIIVLFKAVSKLGRACVRERSIQYKIMDRCMSLI